MSNDLKRYLLAGAKDVGDTGLSPYTECKPASILLRRRRIPGDKRNRLSLDLSLIPTSRSSGHVEAEMPSVVFRHSANDSLTSALKRRSLNLDLLLQGHRRRTVQFDLPTSPRRSPRLSDGSATEEESEVICRSRARRRVQEEEPKLGVNSHLRNLMDVTPRSYAEGQRLKKMLKKAVSGPDATFEDLKAYRIAMKKLRKAMIQEQVKELGKAEEEVTREREFHNFMEKVKIDKAS